MISSQSVPLLCNLGFIFDSDMSFSDQINSVSKSCHFHITRHPSNSSSSSSLNFLQSQLLQMHLSPANLTTAIHFTLASHKQISTNFNAFKIHWYSVITNTSKYQHITPPLKKLHWLPIKQRIDYKICLLTYKTQVYKQQPTYLCSLSFPSHSVST